MNEVFTGRPETQRIKGTIIDFEAARQRRAAGEKTQRPRSRMAPPSRETRQERYTADRLQRIREELSQTEDQPKGDRGPHKSSWTKADDELINEILYGPSKSERERARPNPESEKIERLAKEKGWEAVADTMWSRVGTFNTEFGRKFDNPEAPTRRKLPDREDTREKINARLERAGIRPLSDAQWSEWERMRDVDPATLTQEEWQEWRRNPASLTEEVVGDLEAYQREIAPAKEWLDRFEDAEQKKRWEKVAVPEYAKKLGLDPATLTPEARKTLVDYDPYAFECAQAAGLNPLTLTPEQQKELADFPPGTAQLAKALGLNPLSLISEEREDLAWGQRIITQAQKLGVDPGTLTPDERYDLRRYGRIRTPEERKEREEFEKRLKGNPLTPEEFKELMRKMHKNVQATQREKAAWVHERDPRYDPMTGDLLEPDEFPLDKEAEYFFDGKTRPRRFIPPDSPHLKDYTPLETDEEEEVSEGDYRDRLVNRLRKAGFTEVEPTLMDKMLGLDHGVGHFRQFRIKARFFKTLVTRAFRSFPLMKQAIGGGRRRDRGQMLYEKTQRLRSLSPDANMDFLQEVLRELAAERLMKEDTTGEKVAQFIEELIDFLIALFSPVAREETKREGSTPEAA